MPAFSARAASDGLHRNRGRSYFDANRMMRSVVASS